MKSIAQLLLLEPLAWAQYGQETTESAWLAAMIFGGFLFLAAIGVVVATAIYLLGLRPPRRRLPRGA